MRSTTKHKGKHLHRLKSNPEEQRFATAWKSFCENGNLDYLLGNGGQATLVSDNDAEVAATIVQWLGSPVGQGFLENLGYTKKSG